MGSWKPGFVGLPRRHGTTQIYAHTARKHMVAPPKKTSASFPTGTFPEWRCPKSSTSSSKPMWSSIPPATALGTPWNQTDPSHSSPLLSLPSARRYTCIPNPIPTGRLAENMPTSMTLADTPILVLTAMTPNTPPSSIWWKIMAMVKPGRAVVSGLTPMVNPMITEWRAMDASVAYSLAVWTGLVMVIGCGWLWMGDAGRRDSRSLSLALSPSIP
mmetsp:Transcript_59275/g.71307  ORF Transcript_59275/g.71307 Transcript_59275/m.71307 type:complete len:215 (-) Transcript_59275:425-1069(-)